MRSASGRGFDGTSTKYQNSVEKGSPNVRGFANARPICDANWDEDSRHQSGRFCTTADDAGIVATGSEPANNPMSVERLAVQLQARRGVGPSIILRCRGGGIVSCNGMLADVLEDVASLPTRTVSLSLKAVPIAARHHP